MITKLDNSNESVSNQIYTVFQNAYSVEARLIGVLDFPPLSRSVKNIADSGHDFYGFLDNDCLAAVIEIEVTGKQLEIHSLTVDPKYFRKGIADSLISYVLAEFNVTDATVETAVVNKPAIRLYQKHGFVAYQRWTPSHGIEKLAMSVKLSNQ